MQINNQINNTKSFDEIASFNKQDNHNNFDCFSKISLELFNEIVSFARNDKMHLVNRYCHRMTLEFEANIWNNFKLVYANPSERLDCCDELMTIYKSISWNKRYKLLSKLILDGNKKPISKTIERGSLTKVQILFDLGVGMNGILNTSFFPFSSVTPLIYSLMHKELHIAAFLLSKGAIYEDKDEMESPNAEKRDIFKYLNTDYAQRTWRRTHGKYYTDEELEFLIGFSMRSDVQEFLFSHNIFFALNNDKEKIAANIAKIQEYKANFESVSYQLTYLKGYQERLSDFSNFDHPDFIHQSFSSNHTGSIILDYLDLSSVIVSNMIPFELHGDLKNAVVQAYFSKVVSNYSEKRKAAMLLESDEEDVLTDNRVNEDDVLTEYREMKLMF